MHDLVLKGGRVVDPSQNLDAIMDVAFSGGKVSEIAPNIAEARKTVQAKGRVVSPGLIDLHAHVYVGGTSIGVDPDALVAQSGTTTFVDAGTAGAANMLGFRKHVIEKVRSRVIPYINIAFPGIYAFSHEVMVGECQDLRLLDVRECVRVAREHKDLVCGVKVRCGKGAGGTNGIAPLDLAIEAAEELGLPVMAHLDLAPPTRKEVLSRLRPGDVLTHCFRPFPNAPVGPDGKPRQEVLEARAKGVLYDIGHGKGSFGFNTARGMIRNGFMPDVISSDVHCLSIEGPAYDNLVTMSKLLCLGMELKDVIKATTINVAKAIRRPELGTLKPGSPGDATVLEIQNGKFEYIDVLGEVMMGDKKLVCADVVVGGRLWRELN
jgi:dihydroorotase